MTDADEAIDFVEPVAATDEPLPLLSDTEAIELLRTARRIAVVGASPSPWRASHAVMRYLLGQGYECVPVNPNYSQILGRACFPTLEAATAQGRIFDIVDVFRRPEHTPTIARSAVATGSRALWLQQGIVNEEAARIAHQGGLAVVMDRCTAVLHQHLKRS